MHSQCEYHLTIFGVIGMFFAERVWIKTECRSTGCLLSPCFSCKTTGKIWIS